MSAKAQLQKVNSIFFSFLNVECYVVKIVAKKAALYFTPLRNQTQTYYGKRVFTTSPRGEFYSSI